MVIVSVELELVTLATTFWFVNNEWSYSILTGTGWQVDGVSIGGLEEPHPGEL